LALQAVILPAGKGPIRVTSHPTEDGIDYTRLYFPTAITQIDRLEGQNENLAINVFGWGEDSFVVYRLSERRAEVHK